VLESANTLLRKCCIRELKDLVQALSSLSELSLCVLLILRRSDARQTGGIVERPTPRPGRRRTRPPGLDLEGNKEREREDTSMKKIGS
jgi:hypothetical protein